MADLELPAKAMNLQRRPMVSFPTDFSRARISQQAARVGCGDTHNQLEMLIFRGQSYQSLVFLQRHSTSEEPLPQS